MKKIVTITFVALVLFLTVSLYNYASFATQDDGEISAEVYETINPDDFDPSKSQITKSDKEAIQKKAGIILGWLRNMSVIVSVIVIMVIGVKYILGSIEEKAKYKETLIPIIIGIIMAISGTTLITFIYNTI